MNTLSDYFNTLTAAKVNRIAALNYVEKNPHTIPFLFQLAFDSSAERENIYAAWVWELFTIKDLNRIDPFLKEALPLLPNITNSSMKGSLSKSFWYFLRVKKNQEKLSDQQCVQITTSFLDWVITENKTAPLSFSIKILALFQDQLPEIKRQLKEVPLRSNSTFPKGLYPTFRTVFKN